MEFFCYHRDRAGSMPLRSALIEAHWAYMDGFELIARGPTLDGEVATGSVHIVSVPDAAAARAFAFDEPNYQAGAYRDVLLRRWHNPLGNTMWGYTGGTSGYLVIGLGSGPAHEVSPDGVIVCGSLLSDDGTRWLGTAALLEAPDAQAARAVLDPDRYDSIEVHAWQFGGRR